MKTRLILLVGGLVLLYASVAMAGVMPGQALGGNAKFLPQVSSCTGDFSNGTGVCNIFEEPDNAEQQDFDLGGFVGLGLVSIFDPNGQLSDSLLFYFNANTGTDHVLFQSDGFAQGGGAVTFEDANGNWCWLCGLGNNLYQGVSPTETPEPSSLLLLGSGILGLAGVARRRFL